MENRKTIFKAADRVLQALCQLRKNRYLAALERLRKFIEQNGELGKESRKLGLSLNRNWNSAAGSYCERVCRLLNDISYATHTVKQVAEQPRKEIPKLSVIVADRWKMNLAVSNLTVMPIPSLLSLSLSP